MHILFIWMFSVQMYSLSDLGTLSFQVVHLSGESVSKAE